MTGTELPTNDVALIAFLTASYIGSLALVVRYFLNSQRNQTKIYMEYIETKNGHLSQVTKEHREVIKNLVEEIIRLKQ